MSFESIDPSIQRDMTGLENPVTMLLSSLPAPHPPSPSSRAVEVARGFRGVMDLAFADLAVLADAAFFDPTFVNSHVKTYLEDENAAELQHVDWDKLESAYTAMKELHLKPELIIAPEGQRLFFWKNVFSSLRVWEENRWPLNTRSLAQLDDGDGLYVTPPVLDAWDDIVKTSEPRWSASVMDTSTELVVRGVDEFGFHSGGSFSVSISDYYTKLDMSIHTVANNHPSVESYLTAQALAVLGRGVMMDSVQAADVRTRLSESFVDRSTGIVCRPLGHYSMKQIVIGDWEANVLTGHIGTRLEVK
jgi:hypothetical protein